MERQQECDDIEIQDATPAALFSHVTGRKCYGPVETLKNAQQTH